ncbi:MAG: hypothetical protein AAGA30_05710 [Planctomycetota bacterium]
MSTPSNQSAMQRYFAGLAESTFSTQLGIVDPPMIDYVSELLIRFVRNDTVHAFRSVTGQPMMTIAEMVSEASARLGDAKRELHQHIGDFTLFWAGVYPEALRKPDVTASNDQFENYCAHGRRAYRIASCIETSREDAVNPDLLERLSDRFDLCCYGLREVRRQWEDGDDSEFGPGTILLN